MIKDIIRFNLLLVLTSFVLNSYGQKVSLADTLKVKIQARNSYLKIIQKDSTKAERIDRIHSDYRELIIAIMVNKKLDESVKLAEVNRLIEEKSKKLKELR